MNFLNFSSQSILNRPATLTLLAAFIVSAFSASGFAQVNTGVTQGSTIGSNNATCTETGTCINGSADGSNINDVNTSVQTGDNTNQNSVSTVLYSPTSSGGGAANGGNSALVMPRNPLMMQNASLGRSSFQMQVGANHQAGLAALTGSSNALSWFAQMGLNIPFGKIPQPIAQQHNRKYDDARARRRDANRDVFGRLASASGSAARKSVSGQVVRPAAKRGLNAYNYGTIPANKIQLPDLNKNPLFEMNQPSQPKVLALEPSSAFSRPLNTGDKVGLLEVGREYPYLGHTKSGWVKVLLPKGVEAWAQAKFEYIKNDYTEIDALAFDKIPAGKKTVASR